MKTHHQKQSETLQEFASEVEWLRNFAFADCHANVQEILSLQYFISGIVRITDVLDLKSVLLHVLKLKIAEQAS